MTDCPCQPDAYPFVCPVHGKRMSPHLVHLCQTRPDYRELWIRRAAGITRQMPPQAAWLTCPHRGETIATLPGATLGTGCRTAEQPVYQCDHFHEPVVRRAATSHLERIQAEVPGYTGRTCQRCEIHQAD